MNKVERNGRYPHHSPDLSDSRLDRTWKREILVQPRWQVLLALGVGLATVITAEVILEEIVPGADKLLAALNRSDSRISMNLPTDQSSVLK